MASPYDANWMYAVSAQAGVPAFNNGEMDRLGKWKAPPAPTDPISKTPAIGAYVSPFSRPVTAQSNLQDTRGFYDGSLSSVHVASGQY